MVSQDDRGKDYEDRLKYLSAEDRHRFLYQESVRHHHAARIRSCIVGMASSDLGVSQKVASIIDETLSVLDPTFRNELGMVCESHHDDDLDDFVKYKTSNPFGNSHKETANLQYCSILLRTADLLHITKDRTPSITFRLLNPADPISQQEWAKQNAVRAVRSQVAKDNEGNLDPAVPQDTVEVNASFSDENGFFGLTSYLGYAERQLKLSHEWVALAQKTQGVQHEFPWRFVDQLHLETVGFLPKSPARNESSVFRLLRDGA